MLEIILCCPECGGTEWARLDYNLFECVCCGTDCTDKEMDVQCFEIKE